MTPDGPVDQLLRLWLTTEVPTTTPADLHRSAMEAAAHRRQRPRWLVGVSGGVIRAPVRQLDRPRLRYVVLVLAMILALLATAIIGAALLRVIPEPPGKNGLIAFVVNDLSTRPYFHVHLINSDGSGDHAIAQGSCPMYSLDGSVLAYLDQYRTGLSQVSEVRVTSDAGFSSRRLLNVAGAFPPALSPDGSRMAWLKLAPLREGPFLSEPDFSGRPRELWVTPVSGGAGILAAGLDFAPGESLGAPVWSPDGQSIAFVGITGEVGNTARSYRSSIHVVGSDGATPRWLTSRPGVDQSVAWSPDSQYIAFAGVPDGQPAPSLDLTLEGNPLTSSAQDIYVIGADGSDEHRITSTADDEEQPKWSPDGSRLSYVSVGDSATPWRLAKIELNGPNSVSPPVVTSQPPTSGPFTYAWSPDGQRMVGLSGNPRTTAFSDESPTTLWSIGASLQGQASTLYTTTSVIGWSDPCPPSWQWLAP